MGCWRTLFQSGLIKSLSGYATLIFGIFFVMLGVLFAEEIFQYKHADGDGASLSNNPEAHDHVLRLLAAQLDFYITGFSLFLCLVQWRLIKLISSEAKLSASEQAAIKQANSASETVIRLMEEQTPASKGDDEKDSKEELEETKESLKGSEADLVAIKKQAESTNREYDRLSSEFQQLQQQVSEGDDKKSS